MKYIVDIPYIFVYNRGYVRYIHVYNRGYVRYIHDISIDWICDEILGYIGKIR